MLRTGRRYRKNRADARYDVIVVGSGIGGLCSAALLARMGRKVCVLEQHYTAGGYTHSYERHGYEWDVGVHYIGEVHKPSSMLRRLFDVITDGQLQWAPMDDVYDRIVIGDRHYDLVAGEARFRAEMKRHFPGEAEAIDRYVARIKSVSALVPRFFAGQGMPRVLARGYNRVRRHFLPDYFFKTTRQVLEELTSNQELISVLTGQWGDYGLPPSQSSFMMHAMVAKHYLGGGSYPVGGAARIAETIIPVIRRSGGEVFTYARVSEILVRGKKAVGVRLANGDRIDADVVISDAGLVPTVRQLLPEQAARRSGLAAAVARLDLSAAHLCLYCGFRGDAETLRLPKTNLWLYPNGDHDANVARFQADDKAPLPLIYVSFPSAKDPSWDRRYPHKSTVEIVAPTNAAWFRRWEGTQWQKRGADYEALKSRLADQLLEALFKQMPHLRAALDFHELSTPLSTQWFQSNQQGEIYGLDHGLQRFDPGGVHPATRIKGLYLTGADVVTAGVGGALMGGVMTCCALLGWRSFQVWQLFRQPGGSPRASASTGELA